MTKQLLLAFTAIIASAHGQEPRGLEDAIENLMKRYQVPGGSLAIAMEGKPVYARGFGMAGKEKGEAVRPDSLFRIASVSKPITAAAILKLVESGKLSLDDRLFDRLPKYRDAVADPRAFTITIRDLLQHAGGWDSEISDDPLFVDWETLTSLGGSFPPSHEEVIRFTLAQPLDFTPGTRYAYSNFGYMLLGRVVEAATGMPYRSWVVRNLWQFTPAGSLAADRASGEVKYADRPEAPPVLSIFSSKPEPVPAPYGGFSLALQDASGGWLASAPDLVRFLTKLTDGTVLRAETAALLITRPAFEPADASVWYGLGFQVIAAEGGIHVLAHDGAFAGANALVVHLPGVFTYAALFNSRPERDEEFRAELTRIVLEAVAAQ